MNVDAPWVTPAMMEALRGLRPVVERGKITQAIGTTLRVSGLSATIGQQCLVRNPRQPNRPPLRAEVVGLTQGEALLAPLDDIYGLSVESEVQVASADTRIPFGRGLLGRVINAFGEPLDGRPLPDDLLMQPVYAPSPNPLSRRSIAESFQTGVRAIDGVLTIGQGQRVGIFAMAGGGKSTLLGMLARHARCDVNIIALIGERGREVNEFIEDSLGHEGMARSVLVVSTSDRPALERMRAAQAATAIAEGFRAQGLRVMLMMDSVTRYARALREIGLSVGEPAVRRGYPPSVFSELPRLFERAGNDAHGSITAFYTVLAEDEDGTDPVAEETRSILDGHIILSRALGQAGHYPAIDVLASTSRVFNRVTTREQQAAATRLRALLAKYEEIKFLLQVGEYKRGNDALADEAIARLDELNAMLKQPPEEASSMDVTLSRLRQVTG